MGETNNAIKLNHYKIKLKDDYNLDLIITTMIPVTHNTSIIESNSIDN